MTIADDLNTASDPSTDGDELGRLASSPSPAVRHAVAQNMAAPMQALRTLFVEFPEDVLSNPNSSYFDMTARAPLAWIPLKDRAAVASGSMATNAVLERLAKDESPMVLKCIAMRKSTPAHVLEYLAKSDEFDVRVAVAENENAPASALELLMNDTFVDVLIKLAMSERSPAHVLEHLATEDSSQVRFWVAVNRSTPIHALQRLASNRETDRKVRLAARNRLPR